MRIVPPAAALIFASLLALPSIFLAQVAGSSPGGGVGIAAPLRNIAPPLSGAPYTFTRTSTLVRRLVNGTTITHNMTFKVAQDSTGRRYNEMHHPKLTVDGPKGEFATYKVFDAAAQTRLEWDSGSTIATLIHAAVPVASPVHPLASLEVPAQNLQQPNVSREDLGTRTIAGLETRGTRVTRVIPTGHEGNDAPITVVTETWRSTEYGVIMLSIQDDPRNGIRTEEVTDFEPGEPDAALFQLPDGYSVKEQTVDQLD